MTIGTLFDRAAQRYDQARRQLVPCFDDLYATALRLLPTDRQQPLRILDIGAGTGLLSAFIAEIYPAAQLTLIDIAPDMLGKATERLRPYAERVQILQLDMTQIDTLPMFDQIVSALAIHHLDDQQKQQLFHMIAARLVPGGRFINVEQILGPTPAIEEVYAQIWLEAVGARGVSDEDLAAAIERMRQDQTVPLGTQLRWLEDAGFANVNCWYQWYRFAVYSGDRLA
jgi:tRNA (cmo5U34)-methyltransferase